MSNPESGGVQEARWKMFFTHPEEVPCVRQAFLTGILGGLGVGLGFFFRTSNVRRSTNVGFGSYMLLTMGTWFYCRYSVAQERIKQRQLKKAIQHKISSEGTDVELKDV